MPADLLYDPCLHFVVAHDAAGADLAAAGFELRFDERDDVSTGRQHGRNDRQNMSQGDERDVDGDEVEASCLGRKGVGWVIARTS